MLQVILYNTKAIENKTLGIQDENVPRDMQAF